ncbi:serine hydrolase domain-containing protein [Sphingosinicella rhizophila]|uniref:Serine hydrolase domain-containing protein n=1 Tax=Sphingosinicella rhizophila TaxID=3050082 RepID=A0ABU3Q2Q0_9SPHN|nr:serine hydrolase domain-containing protein [Sphingosinicella sp. GR2756]MDT9597349.1 serine hydrolase domain-containing protein [Sphingosinicella sp. GR2756]
MNISRRHLLGAAAAAGAMMPFRAIAQGASADALAAEFDAWARAQVAAGGPGMTVGVWQGGKTLLTRAYGIADMETGRALTVPTPFHVASVSKQFAAMAVGLLAHEGKVDLDADIRNYLPWMPDFGATIRVEHLIHHVSGLRDQWTLALAQGLDIRDLLTQDRMKNLLRNQRMLNFAPGSDFSYCNSGFTLLAEIVTAVAGQDLQLFAKARMFDPLGMKYSHFIQQAGALIPNRAQSYAKDYPGRPGWQRVPLNYETWGATSLSTNIEDLLAWEVELLHPKVLPQALVDRAAAPYRLTDGRVLQYGFGMMNGTISGRPAVHHSGGDAAFRTWAGRFPEHDAAIVILRNDAGNPLQVTGKLVDIYLPAPAGRKPSPKPLAATDPRVTSLVGSWYIDGGTLMTIAQGTAGIVLQSPQGPGQPLTVYDDDTFDAGQYRGGYYRVHRDPGGRPVKIEPTDDSPIVSPIAFYEPATVHVPDAKELAAIAGSYRSAELDTTYVFAVADGVLTSWTLRGGAPLKWRPSISGRFDTFDALFPFSMAAAPGSDGKVAAIFLEMGRSRKLRFDRVSA